MRPRTSRRTGLVLACLLVGPLLVGCGSGFSAETNEIYQPGVGISSRTGGVYAINMLIVTDSKGNGTLSGALINQRAKPDTLTSVTVGGPGGHPVTSTIVGDTIALAPQQSVQLADTGGVRFQGHLVAGAFYQLTLQFRQAAPVSAQVPIFTNTEQFASVPLGSTPPPTTPSHSP